MLAVLWPGMWRAGLLRLEREGLAVAAFAAGAAGGWLAAPSLGRLSAWAEAWLG